MARLVNCKIEFTSVGVLAEIAGPCERCELGGDFGDYMITNLREAKSNLSQLVQLAAQGEEVVITVRGRPMARLTSVLPREMQDVARKEWADELSAAAEAARVGQPESTKQQFWDELREDRL